MSDDCLTSDSEDDYNLPLIKVGLIVHVLEYLHIHCLLLALLYDVFNIRSMLRMEWGGGLVLFWDPVRLG